MRHTRRFFGGRAHVTEDGLAKLLQTLARCGVTGPSGRLADTDSCIPRSTKEFCEDRRFHAFYPLFTPYYDFHNQQLTALGDIIIDDYLSDITLEYSAHAGLVLTVNAARQLNAVFHNHFTLHLFANQMGFADIAMPIGSGTQSPEDLHASLDFLASNKVGVTPRDTAGTSFHISPIPSCQSPLGWKCSHFIGAVHNTFGAAAARAAVSRMYDLDATGNLPHQASKLLLSVLEHFPAGNVAEAVLAAQGLPLRFVGKSRIIPAGAEDEPASAEQRESPSGSGAEGCYSADEQSSSPTGTAQGKPGETNSSQNSNSRSNLLVLSGFGPNQATTADISLDALAGSPAARSNLSRGPGVVDYVARWKARTDFLVAQQHEPQPEESIGDGWLTPAETQAHRRGPAFAHAVDFSLHTSYADVYGVAQPQDGKVIARRKFKKPVRDPLFYDKMSDMRNGVPINADGEPLQALLDSFYKQHRRLFEVSMLVGNGEGQVVGRAIAEQYTVARDSACKAFLGGVLHDLSRLSTHRHPDAAAQMGNNDF